MTTITIADELIEEAKQFGWNEKTLTDEVSEFIRSKISLMQFRQSTKGNKPVNAQRIQNLTTTTKPLKIADVAGMLSNDSNVKLTVEEMDEGIAKMFENWEG